MPNESEWSVLDALRGPHPALSFEFFPPKDADGMSRLTKQATSLNALAPDFLSMTYGAGGGQADGRQRSMAASLLVG
ncbi:MAG: methylenetetrahydrofolate reductase, partial [Micrococcales bacterium]|nr:methylenetetrahydrofolate reductase [Micrococcales bacterium]